MITVLKITFVIIVFALMGVLLYDKYKSDQPTVSYDSLGITNNLLRPLPVDSLSQNNESEMQVSIYTPADSTRLKFLVNEASDPPYDLFIEAYKNNTMLFRLDLPNGEPLDTPDSLVQVRMPEKTGTNLVSSIFSIYASLEKCTLSEDIEWTTLQIDSLDFHKGVYTYAGAGHEYSIHYYIWQKNDYCITFSLDLDLGAVDMMDTGSYEFDEKEEIRTIETLLGTIKDEL